MEWLNVTVNDNGNSNSNNNNNNDDNTILEGRYGHTSVVLPTSNNSSNSNPAILLLGGKNKDERSLSNELYFLFVDK